MTSSDRSVLWEHGDWDHVHGLRARAGDSGAEGQLQQSWQSGGIPSDGEHLPCLHLVLSVFVSHIILFTLILVLFWTSLSPWEWRSPSGEMRLKFWQMWCVTENAEVIPKHLYHFFAFLFVDSYGFVCKVCPVTVIALTANGWLSDFVSPLSGSISWLVVLLH